MTHPTEGFGAGDLPTHDPLAMFFSGRAMLIAGLTGLALAALFLGAPQVDLWFSGLFYTPEAGFFWRNGATQAVRRLGMNLPVVIAVAVAASVLLKIVFPRARMLIDARAALFLIATLILGPGLLVNGVFKAEWGRPRPVQVTEFGGHLTFQPPIIPSDQCSRNCSFVSGESSAALWTVGLAALARQSRRRRWIVGGLGFFVAVSLLRMSFGGHFLSDVLFAGLFTYLLMGLVWRALYRSGWSWTESERIAAALAGFGERLRRSGAGR